MRLLKALSIILLLTIFTQIKAQDLKSLEQDLSDSVITAKITAKITSHYQLNPLKITVTTRDGIVVLKGNVEKPQAFFDVVKLVQETKGVKHVDTEELEIGHYNTTYTDAYISAKVQAQILRAKLFEDDSIPLVGINVSTDNGIVTVSGSVNSQSSLLILLNYISKVHGVKQVVSNLEIKDDNLNKNLNDNHE